MYNRIKNPSSGKYVNINTKLGKSILEKYIFILHGGSSILKRRGLPIPKELTKKLTDKIDSRQLKYDVKHMTNLKADIIFRDIDEIPVTYNVVKACDLIEKYILEPEKIFLQDEYTNFDLHLGDTKELIEKFIETVKLQEYNIIEVTNPDLKFKYFYQSSGTSREGSNLKGYVLPMDIKPFALQLNMSGIDFRFTKLEDNAILNISNITDYYGIDFNTKSMNHYLRFMNKKYASISKYLTNQLK